MLPNARSSTLNIFKVQRPTLCQHCRFFKRVSIVPIDDYKPIITFTCTRNDCDNHSLMRKTTVKHFQILEEE